MATAGDLFAAIKTLWDASASLNDINGPYKDEKPPNLSAGFPYTIFESIDNELLFYSCSNEYWQSTWSFTVFDRREQDIEAHFELIGAVFDNPTFTGMTTQAKRRTAEHWLGEDKDVRAATLEYITRWSKPRS